MARPPTEVKPLEVASTAILQVLGVGVYGTEPR
jgi:hypothetical protein